MFLKKPCALSVDFFRFGLCSWADPDRSEIRGFPATFFGHFYSRFRRCEGRVADGGCPPTGWFSIGL